MSISKKKNLKSFLIYKLCLLIIILALLGTVFGHNVDTKMEVKQPILVYNDSKEFIESLNDCINWQERNTTIWEDVPREIIIAQAVIESAYGTSRFSKEGNNLFGVMTFNLDEPHLKPLGNKSSKFGAKIYQNKCESVKDYIIVLNTGTAFEDFRELRFQMLKNDDLDVLVLVETLTRYATNPNYIKLLKKTIKSLRNERVSDTD